MAGHGLQARAGGYKANGSIVKTGATPMSETPSMLSRRGKKDWGARRYKNTFGGRAWETGWGIGDCSVVPA
ncbi:MAG: hypothetical protein LBJ58_06895 [Tannerellaceae bacterium]|nr:hypothetical protein [Tannerellaceae bacterium]